MIPGALAVAFGLTYLIQRGPVAAFDSAPRCGDQPGADCRFSGTATIQRTYETDFRRADITFAASGDRVYTAAILRRDDAAWLRLRAGQQVTAELWDFRVTRLAGIQTIDDPHTGIDTPWLSVVPGLIAAGALAGWFWLRRRGGGA